MLAVGTIVRSETGNRYRVTSLLGAGGQGTVYNAEGLRSKGKFVIKIFRDSGPGTVTRIRRLMTLQLVVRCSVFHPPLEMIRHGGLVGYVAAHAPGIPLEEFLARPDSTLVEALQLAVVLTHSINVLHSLGVVHGDIHAGNFMVEKEGDTLKLASIDLDNFAMSATPPPPALGHLVYMAPELAAASGHHPVLPDMETDRYALAALLHEIVLLKHVAAGKDVDEVALRVAMAQGEWIHDPASPRRPRNVGGYPSEMLDAGLARLFRRGLSLNRAERPGCHEWIEALAAAMRAVFICPRPGCGGPSLIDASKRVCPFCRQPYPVLQIRLEGGGAIPLTAGSVKIGRTELSSPAVSRSHAVLRRIGPETWCEPLGRNGVFRWTGKQWARLQEQTPYLIQAGDRLRFADVLATVAAC